MVDLDPLDFAVRHFGEGIRGFHRRHHLRQIHFGGEARHVVLFEQGVNLVAQIFETDFLVARVLGHELRQRAPERLVFIEIGFELL